MALRVIPYVWNVVGILISCTFVAITCPVDVAFRCVLAHVCSNFISLGLFRMTVVLSIFAMWQPYSFRDIFQHCMHLYLPYVPLKDMPYIWNEVDIFFVAQASSNDTMMLATKSWCIKQCHGTSENVLTLVPAMMQCYWQYPETKAGINW